MEGDGCRSECDQNDDESSQSDSNSISNNNSSSLTSDNALSLNKSRPPQIGDFEIQRTNIRSHRCSSDGSTVAAAVSNNNTEDAATTTMITDPVVPAYLQIDHIYGLSESDLNLSIPSMSLPDRTRKRVDSSQSLRFSLDLVVSGMVQQEQQYTTTTATTGTTSTTSITSLRAASTDTL